MTGGMASKMRKRRIDAYNDGLDCRVNDLVGARQRKNRNTRSPLGNPDLRKKANTYLRYVAESLGYTGATIKETIPLLERTFGLTLPELSDGSPRSKRAIAMAEAIRLKTGIELPKQK